MAEYWWRPYPSCAEKMVDPRAQHEQSGTNADQHCKFSTLPGVRGEKKEQNPEIQLRLRRGD